MSIQNISVVGFQKQESPFVVKSNHIELKINESESYSLEKNPLEYLLIGFAASINAIGKMVAQQQNFDLKSIQVEITGCIETKKSKNAKTPARTGFKNIDIVLKPSTSSSISDIKLWMDTVKQQCPLYDNLQNTTPVKVTVVKEFGTAA